MDYENVYNGEHLKCHKEMCFLCGTTNSMRWLRQRCYSHVYGKLTERTGWLYPMLLSQQVVSGSASMSFLANPISAGNLAKLQRDMGSPCSMLQLPSTLSYSFDTSVRQEHSISRSWLVQLWHEEKRKDIRRKNKRVNARKVQMDQRGMETFSSQLPFSKSVFNRQVPLPAEEQRTEILKQPPISQHDVDSLLPTSPEEVTLAPLLARSNLLITRDIEWANIMFAFEQENRYAIVDACYPGSPVGYIREQSNVIFRQTLRSRRPFVAHITDALGNEIFRVRRPFWLINSTIYVEVNGKEVGVVHRRWHLWRRIYDLYLGNKQFAVVENPGFWNWTFTLKDDEDKVLAQIDRDWRGVGLELFTDAGQYVIRFGDDGSSPKFGLASSIQELEVARPLTLSERAVALALAVSLDNDYFSRRGGWGLPLLIAGE